MKRSRLGNLRGRRYEIVLYDSRDMLLQRLRKALEYRHDGFYKE